MHALLALGFVFRVVWISILVTLRRWFKGPRHDGWSWRTELVGEIMRRNARYALVRPLPVVRAALPAAPVPRRLAKRIERGTRQLGGVAAEITTPKGWSEQQATMLYLHGGGYVLCSPATHRELIARIAVATGIRCIAIDYRLAPEHPYPAAIEDCVKAYSELLNEGIAPRRLLIGGDSAGGGLTLATMLEAKRAGLALPRAALLLSPWVDQTCRGETIDSNAKYCYLQRDIIEFVAHEYVQDADPTDPLASPLYADLSGLPPLLIQTGGAEGLLSENLLLAERARAAGVDVTHQVADGMFHMWQAFASVIPLGRMHIRKIGQFVRERGINGETPHTSN